MSINNPIDTDTRPVVLTAEEQQKLRAAAEAAGIVSEKSAEISSSLAEMLDAEEAQADLKKATEAGEFEKLAETIGKDTGGIDPLTFQKEVDYEKAKDALKTPITEKEAEDALSALDQK